MADSRSTHIGIGGGNRARRKSWQRAGARAPVIRKPVKSIGRHADRFYDPVTGRRKEKAS